MDRYEEKKKPFPEGACCGNCRFCDFLEGVPFAMCRKLQVYTGREGLCSDWERQYRTVFEFQDAFPTSEQREEKLKEMTNEEIDVLIASCGTKQGKSWYARHKHETEK